MAYKAYERFVGGIADFSREGITDSFAFARSIDIRTDPQNITVLPRTVKESGTIVTDLVKWGETFNPTLTTYMYGDTGNVYSRTQAGVYSNLFNIANSHGNGLVYSAEDDFLYGASDKLIWRYGPLAGAPTLVADFFGSQGGIPLNTNSLDLEASSSQYASRASTGTLAITSSISFDAQVKPESLPTTGNQMVIASKWNESGALRSYKFDIANVAGSFGDGSDGTLTISSNTTEAPIDSACTGTAGTTTLSATNASFAAGQIVMIHQTRGANAGQWETGVIQSYTAGTITLANSLRGTYAALSQVRVLKQHTNVTVNAGVTYTCKAWNGTTGGLIGFLANGTVTVSGTMTATACGYRGGAAQPAGKPSIGTQGEGTVGIGALGVATANGNGGGAASISSNGGETAGGGGSNGGLGKTGTYDQVGGGRVLGQPGILAGANDLTTMVFGGGGGGGASDSQSRDGNPGGGIIFIVGATTNVGASGLISSGSGFASRGAGGAGGSVLIWAQTAVLGTNQVTASGTTHVEGALFSGNGHGGAGRVVLNYATSYTGTSAPTSDDTSLGYFNQATLNPIINTALTTNTGYQLRLSLSSTGSNSEVLTQAVNIQTDKWQQIGVSWEAASKTATFYLNAVALGTATGALGAIHSNASRFAVGASYDGSGNAANFYDGLIDEVRVFNMTRSASDMFYGLNQQIATNTVGLVGYYKFNGSYVDATANSNDLTQTNNPVFVTDVPYPSPTTRLDIDQSGGGIGDTYAVPTAISEAATDRLSVTPSKDPQKSIQLNIGNIGTGTWVVTVHDQYNNVLATSTVTNANMHTGNYEFVFSSVWRPLTNFTNVYHFHVTCASGSPTLVSSSNNNMETAQYTTFFQYLVEDDYHPMTTFLNYWVVGNERYIGKYEATLYEPNWIVLEAGYRIRCFAYWREYLVIGCTRGDDITDFDNGRIYFWNGYSPTFNLAMDVPEGGINAMLGSKGTLYAIAGYKGQLIQFQGGDSAQKIKDLPKIENTSSVEVFPGAITMYHGLLRYGIGSGDSTAVNRGSYTWGSTNLRYPEILTLDHIISTGNYNSSVNIGMQTVVDSKLLISWKDMLGYGVDYVDAGNSPYASSMIEFLVDTQDVTWKEKQAVEIDAWFTELQASEMISLRYSLEGSTTFTANPDPALEGDIVSRMLVSNGRYNELQVGLDITCDTTAPTVTSVLLTTHLNETEQRTD